MVAANNISLPEPLLAEIQNAAQAERRPGGNAAPAQHLQHIGGQRRSSMSIATVNPATGKTLKTFEPLTAEEVDQRIAKAESAFREHRETDFATRAALMHAAADLLDKERDDIARIMTTEMGKTLAAARAEAAKCAKAMHWYADRGYLQIKIYNSMNPEWVRPLAAEAQARHRLAAAKAAATKVDFFTVAREAGS